MIQTNITQFFGHLPLQAQIPANGKKIDFYTRCSIKQEFYVPMGLLPTPELGEGAWEREMEHGRGDGREREI